MPYTPREYVSTKPLFLRFALAQPTRYFITPHFPFGINKLLSFDDKLNEFDNSLLHSFQVLGDFSARSFNNGISNSLIWGIITKIVKISL